jgi:HK97 family phage major capsid protein
MNLQELLQKRAAAIAKMRSMLEENKGKTLTADEEKAFDEKYKALKAEVESLDKQIEREKEVSGLEKDLDEPFTPTPGANSGKNADPSHKQAEKLDDGGFKNLGEFAHAVKNGDKSGRLEKLSTSDAGIMIPPAFSSTIMQMDGEGEIVGPRATAIPAGNPPDAPFTIPYLQQGTKGALGGISMTWTSEESEKSDVGTPGIKDMTLIPKEVAGLATINNKTLENWAASGALIQNLMQMALRDTRDNKHLFGSGVGCPLGVMKSPGAIKVKRDTAGTIKYIDTLNLLAVLYAGAGEPVYVANQTLMPTIMTLTDGAGRYIFNAGDATKGIPPTLNGIRILWNGKTAALGSEGDLVLAKLNYYLTKQGSGPFLALSEHFKFNTNQTVFRLVANMDGQLWVKEPLTLSDGTTKVSPVVILK